MNQFKDLVVTASAGDQDVLCINERQVMVRSKTMYQEPPSQIDIQQRPTTSFVRRYKLLDFIVFLELFKKLEKST